MSFKIKGIDKFYIKSEDNNTLMEVNEISDCELSTSPDFKPKFFYEGTLVLDTIRDSGLFNDILNSNNNNYCVKFNIPILVQTRYHKKSRINKKWIKRYGFKRDFIQYIIPECILSKQDERDEVDYLASNRLITQDICQDICRVNFETTEIQAILPTYISNNNKLIWFLEKENNL